MRGVVVILAVGAVFWFPGTALAVDPPACPVAPDTAYTGSDDAAHELRELRRESAESCLALTAVLTAVQADTGPLAGKLAQLHDDVTRGPAGTADDPLNVTGQATDTTTSVPGSSDDNPAHVVAVPADAERADDAATALHSDLWFLIGGLLGLPFAFFFLREVLPWRS